MVPEQPDVTGVMKIQGVKFIYRRREMPLARRMTKPGFSKDSLWGLMRGIALLLLFTNQSWASVICNCADANGSQHTCCHSHASRGHHCGSEGIETKIQPQEAEMCCHLSPQAEEQTFSITASSFPPAESYLQGAGTLVPRAFTSESAGVAPSARYRPLYLTHSSLLI